MPPTTAATGSSANLAGQAPAKCWLRVWLLAVLICATSLGSLEAFWRSQGYEPSVPDSAALWAYHRARVVGHNPKLIVAIGTSRIRSDLSSAVIAERLPEHQFIQLGVNGSHSCLGTLQELSLVRGFCGTVICDVQPPLVRADQWNDQAYMYRVAISRLRILDAVLQGLLCDRLAVLNPARALRILFCTSGLVPSAADVSPLRAHLDRSLTLRLARSNDEVELGDHGLRPNAEIPERSRQDATVAQFERTLAPLAEIVGRIRDRGGMVLFVRLPASGGTLEREEGAFPSRAYTQALAHVTSEACVDFRDLGLSGIVCPDGSHLSEEAAQRFTERLLSELRSRSRLAARDIPLCVPPPPRFVVRME